MAETRTKHNTPYTNHTMKSRKGVTQLCKAIVVMGLTIMPNANRESYGSRATRTFIEVVRRQVRQARNLSLTVFSSREVDIDRPVIMATFRLIGSFYCMPQLTVT